MITEQQSQEPDFTRNDGLLPAIAQDADSGKILMMAWMNAEAYRETVQTGRAVYSVSYTHLTLPPIYSV